MYWRVASFQHASPLDSLLDKELVTVEELLDEDDLIQETRALNPKVISFLSQPSNLEVTFPSCCILNMPLPISPLRDGQSSRQARSAWQCCMGRV